MNKPIRHSEELSKAIEQLEIKVAYQEHTIDQLNEEITRQNKDIEQLRLTLQQLIKRIKTFEPSELAKQSEEMPPPHY
jgi:SlyX protein